MANALWRKLVNFVQGIQLDKGGIYSLGTVCILAIGSGLMYASMGIMDIAVIILTPALIILILLIIKRTTEDNDTRRLLS